MTNELATAITSGLSYPSKMPGPGMEHPRLSLPHRQQIAEGARLDLREVLCPEGTLRFPNRASCA